MSFYANANFVGEIPLSVGQIPRLVAFQSQFLPVKSQVLFVKSPFWLVNIEGLMGELMNFPSCEASALREAEVERRRLLSELKWLQESRDKAGWVVDRLWMIIVSYISYMFVYIYIYIYI